MTDSKPRKLSHYFTASRCKGRAGLPLMSVTMHNGLVRRDELDRKMDSALTPEEHLLVEPNDIAYNTMRMWQGCFGLAEEAANVSPAYVVMRPKDTVDPRFAAHWFKSDRGLYMLWAYSYGLTEDRLRLYGEEFLLIPVKWPNKLAQQRIADVIDSWDDAIASAETILEQKAKTAHVDVAKLISNLPMISLGELARVKMGQSPPSSSYREAGSPNCVPLAGGAGDFGRQGFVECTSWTIKPQKTVTGKSVIMSVRAPVGSYVLSDGKLALGRGVCALTPKGFDNTELLGFLIGGLESYWHRIKQGGTFEAVNSNDIREAPVPDVRGQHSVSLGKLIEAQNKILRLEAARIQLLRRQKRGLMQKLLTGEWPVPESIDRLMPGGDAAATLAREASAA